MQVIASKNITAIDKETKAKIDASLEIYLPVPTDDGKDYFCHFQFKGLESDINKIGGIDAVQALMLAVQAMKIKFTSLQKKYDFYWPDSEYVLESLDYSVDI